MDKYFSLEIVTPIKTLDFDKVVYLRAPSLEGLFGVMPGHVGSIINLDIGEVKVLSNNKENYFAISGGFAQVSKDKVSLLVESIELKSDIDKLVNRLEPLGLASVSRTGAVAMTKGAEVFK